SPCIFSADHPQRLKALFFLCSTVRLKPYLTRPSLTLSLVTLENYSRWRRSNSPALGGSLKGNSKIFPSRGRRSRNSSCFFQLLIHLLLVLNRSQPVASGLPASRWAERRLSLLTNSINSAVSFW